MEIEVALVSAHEAESICTIREDHFTDVKSKEISPAKLSRTVSAFANSDGGELYVGVSEQGPLKLRSWLGFPDIEAANGHIQLLEQLFPLNTGYQADFLETKSSGFPGLVLHIQVPKARDVVLASDGLPYIRKAAQNLPVSTVEALQKLRWSKGITSFENETIDVPLEIVTESDALREFMSSVVPSAEPLAWLKKQLLVRAELPTVAAVLLFADEPQAALPKRAGLKIYRYRTKDPVGLRENLAFDPLTIEGPAYHQIRAAVATTQNVIEDVEIFGAQGIERVQYPPEALHEIITNAVLHRDYSHQDDIHVRIFDNRVEVESPGLLPGHITPENILFERLSRNGALVRLINKFPNPPNKDVGEGLNTAFQAMKKLRLKEPSIIQRPNSVLVNIRHESLDSPEELIMEYLEGNEEISNKVARELTNIGSENSVKRIFQGLMKKGLIERVPGRTRYTAAYRKKVIGPPNMPVAQHRPDPADD